MVTTNSYSCFIPSVVDIPLTQQELNSFHQIDRALFARLVLSLRRDPNESMQVMALLIWLEQGYSQVPNLVFYLLSLSDSLINNVVDESIFCLHCIQCDEYSSSLETIMDEVLIPTIHKLVKPGVSLKFLYENRFAILNSVFRNVNEVCERAFKDILQRALLLKETNGLGIISPPICTPRTNYLNMFKSRIGTGVFSPNICNTFNIGCSSYDLASKTKILNNEIEGVLAVNTTKKEEDSIETEVLADDRTIFLTFSKGYIVSQDEVKDFFTRKFGDCFEEVFMQEVSKDKQSLFARLVLRSHSLIPVLLGGKFKAKFNINGKHVWGRKYVPKNNKSSQGSPSSSQLNSPPNEAT